MQLLRKIARGAAFVVEGFVAQILRLLRVRFLLLTAPNRIGHLCTDVSMFVKRRELGLEPRHVGVLIAPPGATANEWLLGYWKKHVVVLRSRLLARLATRLTRFKWLEYDARTTAINETSPYIAVDRAWRGRPPLARLSTEDARHCTEQLAKLGVPLGARFICFHCREPGYSPADDDNQSFRNADVASYIPALEWLAKQDVWCIRMGGPETRPLPALEKHVDYAHSELRSDRMDVALCASALFFLGSSSGLVYLANLFGRATGSANHAPVSTALAFGDGDLSLFKLVWSEEKNRLLTFPEILGSEVGNFRYTNLYRERGLRIVDNSPEDILALATEMLERVEGRAVYTAEDEERQQRFASLLRPGHFSYCGLTRVGRDFLRKYASLLGDRPVT